jgi:hypothetical protein
MLWELYNCSATHALFGDFRAFYCAGAALAHGANPYAASAIYACERSPMPLGLAQAPPGVAVPAPFPGYALFAFVPFGMLAYLPACALWLALLAATIFLSAWALTLLLDRSFEAMLATVAVGFAVVSLPYGELGSVIVVALLWLALALRRGAWTWAAVAAALAMMLPHVALPALISVFLFIPQMRARLVALAAMLVAIDLLCGGPVVAFSYVRDVLPAHARAEIGSTAQYGMTWILHGLHASDKAAIAGGEVSYAIMTLLGILAARAFMVHSRDLAYAVLIPPAFAVLGGTFMHYTQIMVAIPAALLLLQNASGRARRMFAAALLLLAVPWTWALGEPPLIVLYALLAAAIAALVLRWNAAQTLRTSLGAALTTGVILIAGAHFGSGLHHARDLTLQGGLAQASWQAFVQSQRASSSVVWWIAKAPTWLGLLLLTLGCAYVLAKKEFEAPVAIEQVPIAT